MVLKTFLAEVARLMARKRSETVGHVIRATPFDCNTLLYAPKIKAGDLENDRPLLNYMPGVGSRLPGQEWSNCFQTGRPWLKVLMELLRSHYKVRLPAIP